MIALDTNVLVRYLVQDDQLQSSQANKIMESLSAGDPGWVSIVTLVELVWAMTRIYGVSPKHMSRILDGLLSRKELVFEQEETIRCAALLFRSGRAEFADCLIAMSARAAGCTKTITFDRLAARDAAMELIQ